MITRRQLPLLFVRLLVVYAALCAGTYFGGDHLLMVLSPIFKMEIEARHPEYRVDSLVVAHGTVSLAVKATYDTGRGFRAKTSTGPSFTYPILVLTLLAVWPFDSRRRRLFAIGSACVLLAAILAIDLPANIMLAVADITQKKEPYLLFLYENGGRQFLSLIILSISLGASRSIMGPAANKSNCPNNVGPTGNFQLQTLMQASPLNCSQRPPPGGPPAAGVARVVTASAAKGQSESVATRR